MTITLTPKEEADIFRARQQKAFNNSGAYGVPDRKDAQREALRHSLDMLNERGLTMGYGELPGAIDPDDVKAIKKSRRSAFRCAPTSTTCARS
jgi:hypothetical protein